MMKKNLLTSILCVAAFASMATGVGMIEKNTMAEADVNVAQYAIASSTGDWNDGVWNIKNVNDGQKMRSWSGDVEQDTNTRTLGWRSKDYAGEEDKTNTLTLTLVNTYEISSVLVYPRGEGNAFPVDYSVEYQDMDGDWQLIESVTGESGLVTEGKTHALAEPVQTRGVRLVMTKPNDVNDGGAVYEISEVEIMGTEVALADGYENLAMSAILTTEGDQMTNMDPNYWHYQHLNDGDKLWVWGQEPTAGRTLGWSAGASNQTDEISLTCALANASKIAEVVVYPRGGGAFFPQDYVIETSEDGESWTTQATVVGDVISQEVKRSFPISAENITHVRLRMTKQSSGNDGSDYFVSQISEIEIYGLDNASVALEGKENVARTATLTSNVDANSGVWALNNLIDGQKMRAWAGDVEYGNGATLGYSARCADANERLELTFTLSTLHELHGVVMYPRGEGNRFPVDYEILLSSDGINYNTVKSVTGDTSTSAVARKILFPAQYASSVRIVCTKTSTDADQGVYCYEMSEVEIYSAGSYAISADSRAYNGQAFALTADTDEIENAVYSKLLGDCYVPIDEAPVNCGKYKVEVTFNGVTQDLTLYFEITKKTLTVNVETGTEIEYGTVFEPKVTVNGFVVGENESVLIEEIAVGLSATEVGLASILLTQGKAENYDVVLADEVGLIRIVRATPTITPLYNKEGLKVGDVMPTISVKADGTEGTIIWLDTVLVEGTKEYRWLFTPTDTAHYQRIEGTATLMVAEDTQTPQEPDSSSDEESSVATGSTDKKKSGCGSVLGTGLGIMATMLGGCVVALFRKKNKNEE